MHSPALPFVLFVLVVYRLSHMIANEEGPFSIFLKLRDGVGQKTWVGRGFNCVLCLSFWLALPAAIYMDYYNLDGGYSFWLWWLAIAGGVLVLHRGFLGSYDP